VIADSGPMANTVTATRAVGYAPQGVAFDSHLNEVFVTNFDSGFINSVSVIPDSGPISNVFTERIPVGSNPHAVVFDSFASYKKDVSAANNVSVTISVLSSQVWNEC